MRELKFRAWDKSVEHLYEVQTLIDGGDAIGRYVLNGEMYYIHLCADDVIIEQYTGLKDKNGKEIYEGDIVQRGANHVAIIKWSQSNARFIATDVESRRLMSFDDWTATHELVIIGNARENPELLEEEE